jgi:hypothetical protein
MSKSGSVCFFMFLLNVGTISTGYKTLYSRRYNYRCESLKSDSEMPAYAYDTRARILHSHKNSVKLLMLGIFRINFMGSRH